MLEYLVLLFITSYPPASAKILGLTGNYITINNDPYTVWYNPASLPSIENKELLWTPYLYDIRNSWGLYYAQPLKNFGIGAGVYTTEEGIGMVGGIGFKFKSIGTGISIVNQDYEYSGNFSLLFDKIKIPYIPGLFSSGLSFYSEDETINSELSYFIGNFIISAGFFINYNYEKPVYARFSTLFSYPLYKELSFETGFGIDENNIGMLVVFKTKDIGIDLSVFNPFYYNNQDVTFDISLLFQIGHKETSTTIISHEENRKIERELRKAVEYESKKDYRTAYKIVLNLSKKYPDNVKIQRRKDYYENKINTLVKDYNKKGVEFYNKKDYKTAKIYFKKTLSLDPTNKTALRYVNLMTKKYSKKELDQLYFKGLEAYTNNDFEKALYYWKQLYSIQPHYPNLKANINKAKEKLKQTKN